VARIVESSEGGWVSDSARPEQFPERIAAALDDPGALERRAAAAAAYARHHFSPEGLAERFEEVLWEVVRDDDARG
jgi:glycosyltransferase involved in cell wall biosynthesis